jgi:glucose/arabinose dehydrogenase/mono/diheme cytochrome c family protein
VLNLDDFIHGCDSSETRRRLGEHRATDAGVTSPIALGDTIVKALARNGHPDGVPTTVKNMLTRPRWRPALVVATSGFAGLLPVLVARAEPPTFHQVPLSAASLENPYRGQAAAARAGGELYAVHCAACHGTSAEGTGNVPALAHGALQRVPDGEVFWFITRGSRSDAMPSWASLPEEQRWQLVTYLKTLVNEPIVAPAPDAASMAPISAPPPVAPFSDFRFEVPGTVHKITVRDLPAPFTTRSAGNAPSIVTRPADAWPKAPEGFRVQLYADGLAGPRVIHVAPNGDVFVAESGGGRIRVFRGLTADGKPERTEIFAANLTKPYGLAFYPAGSDPKWLYVANTDSVLRFPYRNGDLEATGAAQHIVDLPHGSGHWTRDVVFSADGKTLFVAVGSGSNVDDPDTTPAERNRADILAFRPDGSHMRVYASGIRNPSGLAVDPRSGQLWCAVNERDGLGDNLVPDYITPVRNGGFYGWPWWYMGPHQDPRHAGKHPELRKHVITPEVLLQPHSAPLQLAFYQGEQFPDEYRGDIFASSHGSWNKAVRTGYKIIRVPLRRTGQASGVYQDFLTGFVLPNGQVWGRPVGVTTAADGSLLVTDDGSNSIWRVSYAASAD